MVYDLIYNLTDIFFVQTYIIKLVKPMIWHRDFNDLIKVLIEPAFQLILAWDPDTIQHLLRKLAEGEYSGPKGSSVNFRIEVSRKSENAD